MDKKVSNQNAFPVQNMPELHLQPYQLMGMTLRDWFAGQALSGIASRIGYSDAESQAIDCYKIADAMLLEREKTNERVT